MMSAMPAAFDRFCATHARADTADPVMLPTASRHDLGVLFAALGYRTGAEIGTWVGLFAEDLCRSNRDLVLTCVDPWRQYAGYNERKNRQVRLDEAYREARTRLAPLGCRILRMDSAEAATHSPDRSLDFVYIDGNHHRDYVLQDLALWTPKVRSGGIIAGHDFELPGRKAPWIDVREAVIAWTTLHHISPWYVACRETKAPSFFWMIP